MAEKILVVDDEATIVRLCQRLLERAGFDASGTTDPAEALNWVRQKPYDMLVADIRMPAVDGFELAAQCRAIQPDLAVLIMTGYGNLETAIQALRRGVDGLLLKPIEVDGELVDTARQVLADRRARQDAARLQALRPLFDVSEALLSESTPEAVERKTIGELQAQLGADRIGIYSRRPDETELSLLAAKGLPFPWEVDPEVENPLDEMDRAGTPLMVSRWGETTGEWTDWLARTGWCGFAAVPVRRINNSYLFFTARAKEGLPFSEADLELLTILARQAAVAIENASLYVDLLANIQKVEESQRALVQAEKMSALGRLLVSVAHEVNNPLQSVRNCVHLAGRDEIDRSARIEVLDMAASELDRLGKIVGRMLDFYRPGGLDVTASSLAFVVNRVLDLLGTQLRQSHIQVITNFHQPPVIVHLQEDQMQQVVLNLLINAMDALQNQPDATIWVEERVQGDQLVLSIEDSGAGVPRGMEEIIFEPYFSTKPSGTGMGLSISYGLVKAHQGTLSLEKPRYNSGARFEILLPLSRNDVQSSKNPSRR